MVQRLATRNKTAEGSRREAGAVRGAHRRRDAERARGNLVRDNKQEGALLKTGAYRQQIAEALFDAIVRYQQSLKRHRTVAARRRAIRAGTRGASVGR